jgi:hypothetical protein
MVYMLVLTAAILDRQAGAPLSYHAQSFPNMPNAEPSHNTSPSDQLASLAHTVVPPHLPGCVIPPPGHQYLPREHPAGLLPPRTVAPLPHTGPIQEQCPQSQTSSGSITTTMSMGTIPTLSQSERAFRERRDQWVLPRYPQSFFFMYLIYDFKQ